MGLWHELGKFNPRFQEYIRNPEAVHGRIDHSSAGAVFAADNFGTLVFLIAYPHGTSILLSYFLNSYQPVF